MKIHIVTRGALAVMAAVAPLVMPLNAATYYVDPTGGTVSSDDYDGTAETWAGGESTVGPKKTLAAALKDRVNGDVVIALPGTYAEGVSNPEDSGSALTLNRAVIPSGVKLLSRDGAEKTIILGETAPVPDGNGCGTDAVRCLRLSSNTRVEGFTLAGGRVTTWGTASSYLSNAGGAAYCDTSDTSLLVDCIISNNAAYYGGAVYRGVSIRSRFGRNPGLLGTDAFSGSRFFNCYFANARSGVYNLYSACVAYNCTFANGGGQGPRNCTVYNCLLLNNAYFSDPNTKFYDCVYVKEPGGSSTYSNCTLTNAEAVAIDPVNYRPVRGSAAIDAGNLNHLHAVITAAIEWSDLSVDVLGGARLCNGALDVGCGERDWYEEYSEALSPRGAAEVTNATSYVELSGECLNIPTNGVATVLLKPFNDAESLYSFFAEVTGSGTLSVYLDGSDTPAYTFSSVDGLKETKFLIDAVKSARFAYSGEDGHAAISRFSNVTAFTIGAAQNGIAVSGGLSIGTTYVGVGETVSFTVTRAYDSDVVCLGINANGTFLSFDDNPGGMSFTVDGNDRTTEVSIEAVYKTGLRDWYVDANGGSDSNTGLYTNNAFKTLKAAVLNPRRTTGEVIYALPGVYQDGVCTNSFWLSSTQWEIYSRAYLEENTVLKSLEGPEKTFIVGTKSTTAPAASNGCGEGAVRCLYMRANSWLEGFTLTGGYSPVWASNNSYAGGAVYFNGAGAIVDCIVSNNYAYCGGAFSGGYIYRSRIYRNGGTLGTDAYNGTRFVNCYILNDRGSIFCLYSGCHAFNCTFGPNGQGPRNSSVYNSILLNSSYASNCNTKFYNCVMVGTPPDAASVLTDCTNVPAASLKFDKFMRPKSGSIAIDYGSWDRYLSVTNTLMTIEKISQDLYGGERVAGGGIDAGCGEFDVRLLPGFLIKIW